MVFGVGRRSLRRTAAPRLCLHAARLQFEHPATGQPLILSAAPDFAEDARWRLRGTLIDPTQTDAFRLVHGAADGWPGLYTDRLGGICWPNRPRR